MVNKKPNARISKSCLLCKVDEREYIDIAETIWGAVPFDVAWAIGTGIYKDEWLARKRLLKKSDCYTTLRDEVLRCRAAAIQKKEVWGNGMSEHAIEARAMIMLCDHLLEFVHSTKKNISKQKTKQQ